ncbi:MAG: HEAT repeat domain-containing protein [Bryobacterales bacterium]|nr:HEAT repeat domain-containing protein [Bryobacterales bacterium]
MTCADARSQFWLLEYGELSFDEEERVETHLDACADCRAAFEREKEVYAAFNTAAAEPPPSLLRQCRAELASRLESEEHSPAPDARRVFSGWWEQFTHALTGGFILRPAGALAMLVLGFAGARFMPNFLNSPAAGVTEAGMNRVRDVKAAANGQIQILVDETRQRTLAGGLDDSRIRGLLLEAAKDPSDAGLRQQSLSLLNAHAQSADIRDALIYALQHDQNAGVRLNAMTGLKAFAAEPEVRGALSQTLLSDPNPGIRMQAIDLLTQDSATNMDRQMVGTLQELMLREDNEYLRQRSQKILEAINASTEIY